mgnify:CR=1 FL=1
MTSPRSSYSYHASICSMIMVLHKIINSDGQNKRAGNREEGCKEDLLLHQQTGKEAEVKGSYYETSSGKTPGSGSER